MPVTVHCSLASNTRIVLNLPNGNCALVQGGNHHDELKFVTKCKMCCFHGWLRCCKHCIQLTGDVLKEQARLPSCSCRDLC